MLQNLCPGRRPRAHARREPLFTLIEIGERVGMTQRRLASLLSNHREQAPAAVTTTSNSHGGGRISLYRLTEFMRWMDHHKFLQVH